MAHVHPKTIDKATPETVDWGFYDNPEIVKLIENAAWEVTKSYTDFGLDVEDLIQDGLLYVACRPEMVERYSNDLAFLRQTVWRYLNEKSKGEVYRSNGIPQTPYVLDCEDDEWDEAVA